MNDFIRMILAALTADAAPAEAPKPAKGAKVPPGPTFTLEDFAKRMALHAGVKAVDQGVARLVITGRSDVVHVAGDKYSFVQDA